MGLCPTRAITGRSNYCSVTEPFDIVGQTLLNNTVIVVVLRKKTIGSINLSEKGRNLYTLRKHPTSVVSREMMTVERLQKCHTDDVSLPRPGLFF